MVNVLFVGATGLVGSHVIPILKEHYDLTPAALDGGVIAGIPVLSVDICSWEAIESTVKSGTASGDPFDAIVYCATANYRQFSHSDVEGRRRYYENCIEVNVRGAYHVYEAARRGNVPRVVHVGSLTAMLGEPAYDRIDTNSLDRPDDLYAATKIFGEHVGRSYVFRSRREELHGDFGHMKVLCLRLGQPFESENQWRTGPHTRLAVSMEDIATAIHCALSTSIDYGVYPITSEVEDPWVEPSLYAELGYRPGWRFTEDRLLEITNIPNSEPH